MQKSLSFSSSYHIMATSHALKTSNERTAGAIAVGGTLMVGASRYLSSLSSTFDITKMCYEALIRVTPWIQIVTNTYILYLAIDNRFRSKYKINSNNHYRKIENRPKSKMETTIKTLLYWINSRTHRISGSLLLLYGMHNAVKIIQEEPLQPWEFWMFTSQYMLNAITALPLFQDLPYSNTRIQRLFAGAVTANVGTGFYCLWQWGHLTNDPILLKLRHVLSAGGLLCGVYNTVMAAVDMYDALFVYWYGADKKNESPLKKRDSRSYAASAVKGGMPDVPAGLLNRQSSALEYSPLNRVFVRSAGKIFQKTKRHDAEERITTTATSAAHAFGTVGAIFAVFVAGVAAFPFYYLLVTDRLEMRPKIAMHYLRTAHMFATIGFIAPFTATLYFKGRIGLEHTKMIGHAVWVENMLLWPAFSYFHKSGNYKFFAYK